MSNPTIDPALPALPAAAVVLASAIIAIGVLLPSSAAAQVYRCEGADGRITYTNERCPGTARRTRTVDDSPPVQAPRDRPVANTAARPEQAVAKTDGESPRAGAAKAEAVKSDPAKERAAAPARATAAGATASRLHTTTNLTPAQQIEQLDQERDRQRSACEQMLRRIDFAYNDFQSATDGQRASYELQLRRLQEDYLVQCRMQR